jgi:hypothetical protein
MCNINAVCTAQFAHLWHAPLRIMMPSRVLHGGASFRLLDRRESVAPRPWAG